MHTNLMFGLFASLALLGLSAIDPIGIAAMPLLLIQKSALKRSLAFLGGSFISLMVMGLLFALGLGKIVLNFDKTYAWFVPGLEAIAGVILLFIAGAIFLRAKRGRATFAPSKTMVNRLQMGKWQLFTSGALLVAVQSFIDIVFVIAMVRIGRLHLSTVTLLAAVATYAIAALALQIVVVAAYKLTPPPRRSKTLDFVQSLLVNYANQALVGVSFLLGCLLIVIAIF